MRPPSNGSRRRQRGSVLVESSLTLLAFVSLFVATLDLAQILYIHQSLVERARVAARTAAVNCCNVDSVRNTILYGSSATPAAGPRNCVHSSLAETVAAVRVRSPRSDATDRKSTRLNSSHT